MYGESSCESRLFSRGAVGRRGRARAAGVPTRAPIQAASRGQLTTRTISAMVDIVAATF